jgi:hypothetical protein
VRWRRLNQEFICHYITAVGYVLLLFREDWIVYTMMLCASAFRTPGLEKVGLLCLECDVLSRSISPGPAS